MSMMFIRRILFNRSHGVTGCNGVLICLFRGKWCADCLMIDGLVSQCGERLVNLWKRDDGGTGQYPPPTLHVSIASESDAVRPLSKGNVLLMMCYSLTNRPCWTYISWRIWTKLPNTPLYPFGFPTTLTFLH